MLNVTVAVLTFLAIMLAAVSLFSIAKSLKAALELAKAAHADYRRVHRDALTRPALHN